MNLTINPYNIPQKNVQPSFMAGKVVYKELKQIPKLTCACCGKKMVTPDAFEKFITTVARPLIQLIKKGVFREFFQDVNLAKILTDVAEEYPNDSLDKILNNQEIKKKISKVCLSKQGNYQQVKLAARSELRSADVVLKRLASFRDIMSEDKKETYDLLCAYAKEYPRKTLSQIVQLDEVQNLHWASNEIDRTKIKKLNGLHFDKIVKLIKADNPDIDTDQIINELKKIIMQFGIKSENFSDKVKGYMLKILSSLKKEKTKEKILTEAEMLKPFPQGADHFFIRAKKRGYNDFVIIQYFLCPSMATFEHIKPKIDGGSNSKNNGIVLCEACNGERQHIPYEEFIQYHPDMPYNVQKQILQISDLILKGKVSDEYRDWPIKVASTLYENSDGKINPDITSYCKKANRKYGKNLEKRSQEISDAHKELALKKSAVEELEKILQDFYGEIKGLKEEISAKNLENQADKILLKEIKEALLNGKE